MTGLAAFISLVAFAIFGAMHVLDELKEIFFPGSKLVSRLCVLAGHAVVWGLLLVIAGRGYGPL